jgi:hypothetical protein
MRTKASRANFKPKITIVFDEIAIEVKTDKDLIKT